MNSLILNSRIHAITRNQLQGNERIRLQVIDVDRMLQSTSCNVLIGLGLIVVGSVVTYLTFKEKGSAVNKFFLLGPVLVIAGILGIAKAFMRKYRVGISRNNVTEQSRTRNGSRNRTTRHTPIIRDTEAQDNVEPRSADMFPPPYPLLSDSPDTQMLPQYSELDPLPPPPKYEEIEFSVEPSSGDNTIHIESMDTVIESQIGHADTQHAVMDEDIEHIMCRMDASAVIVMS